MYKELSVHACRLNDSLISGISTWTKHTNGAKLCSVDLPPVSPLTDAQQELCAEARAHVGRAGQSNDSFESKYSLRRVTAVESYSACTRFASHLVALSSRAHPTEGWPGPGPFRPEWHMERFTRYGQHDVLVQSAVQLAWRRRVAERFAAQPARLQRHSLCPWARVLTVFHACWSFEVAATICRSGFAALSTRDPGFYGQGLYFTGDLDYAAGVYGRSMRDESGRVTVLVCDVAVGNAYPVIELPDGADSLKGRPQAPAPPPTPTTQPVPPLLHHQFGSKPLPLCLSFPHACLIQDLEHGWAAMFYIIYTQPYPHFPGAGLLAFFISAKLLCVRARE